MLRLHPLRVFLFFLLVLILETPYQANRLYAKAVPCVSTLQVKKKEAAGILESIEEAYRTYRWTEVRIRKLAYDNLWKDRTQMLDPLSEDERKKGKLGEEYDLDLLNRLEDQSEAASNRIKQLVDGFENAPNEWQSCCVEKQFKICAVNALKPAYKIMEEFRTHFDHVFESERDFRKAVFLTAGGRSGNYPEDAVEDSADHVEFYWRFEREREVKRFEEDHETMSLIDEARQDVMRNSNLDSCCDACATYPPQ